MKRELFKSLVKECVNIISEELDFHDQLLIKYKQARKEKNPEKMVYYSQTDGKSAIADFDTQFKGSWAYGEWLKKNQQQIDQAKQELKRFSYMRENEMYNDETDSFSVGPRDRMEPSNPDDQLLSWAKQRLSRESNPNNIDALKKVIAMLSGGH